MFIKVRQNLHHGSLEVLAVNLNTFDRIIIHKVNNRFQLALDAVLPQEDENPITLDPATKRVTIDSYETHQEALEVFQDMMDALKDGCRLWSPEE